MKLRLLPFVCLSALILSVSDMPVRAQHADDRCVADRTVWMKHIAGSTAMCQLSIPGTHDSGATRGGAALQTQGCGIDTQLQLGIRAFDIRLQKKDGKLGIFHSNAFQGIYWEQDVLPAFIRFLQEHPSETLVVSLKKEGGAFEEYAPLLNATLEDARNLPYFVTDFNPELTLEECRGKILFLHRDPSTDHYPGAACLNWADNATCLLTLRDKSGKEGYALLQDEYQYQSDKEAGKKLEACTRNLKKIAAKPSDSQRWGISFASATGLPTGTPQAFANQVNAPLAEYIKHCGLRHCGIVFIDFVEQEGGEKLVMQLIHNNFPQSQK